MSFIKWLRKHRNKIMAIVVIVIMFGFIGGAYLEQLGRRRTGQYQVVAYYDDKKPIRYYDLAVAQQELSILNMLRANTMLRSIPIPMHRVPDFRALLLAELLFPERGISPAVTRQLRQIIKSNDYRISSKQIDDIYRRQRGSDVYWFLLKSEAEEAGIRFSKEDAGKQLAAVIPHLFKGATYAQAISSIVNPRSSAGQQGISEDQVLQTFAKLLGILEYAQTVCTGENLTSLQIKHNLKSENESLDVEFVKFDAAVFAKSQATPPEEKLVEQFEKYKTFFEGEVNEQNPYGFGYKLPERVSLEYMAVKLDEISKTIPETTQDEAQQYYQKHPQQFTVSVPSDPNDPNSTPVEKLKSYPEVMPLILDNLQRDKTESKAANIIREASTLTEAGLEDLDTEANNLTAEQLKQRAKDYGATAKQLGEKYNITVYTGRTGLLDAVDIQTDKNLGTLYVQTPGYNPQPLAQVVFAAKPLDVSELGPFDVPQPTLYQNIGPLRDITENILGLARIIEAEKAAALENIDVAFSKNTLKLGEENGKLPDVTYSIKERVTEDLKKLSAMDTAKEKAEEFIETAKQSSWQDAVDKLNRLYGRSDTNEPNAFKLQDFTDLRRIPAEKLYILNAQSQGNPIAKSSIYDFEKEKHLIDRLYALVPADGNTAENLPLVMESKPGLCYYVLTKLSANRFYQQNYERSKALRVFRENVNQTQSLAPVFFNPEYILKRTKFRPAKQEGQTTNADTPVKSEGKS
jgi:hypothetical protein